MKTKIQWRRMRMYEKWLGLQILALALTMAFTVVMYAQRPQQQQEIVVQTGPRISQETRDALQDADLRRIETTVDQHTRTLETIRLEMYEVKTTLVRLNAIGIGFGTVLSVLLALDVYFRVRGSINAAMKPS